MHRHICSQPTPFGEIVLVWSFAKSRPRIERIFLPAGGASAARLAAHAFPDAGRSRCDAIDGIADGIARFLRGDEVEFHLGDARLDLCSQFQQSVLRAEHAIPRGRVSTYGRIALHLGVPRGARAVGNCLARNPFPIIIPCHRAIRSDGTLGGYQGGPHMKRALLELEGIRFDHSGRVVVSKWWS
jgi:methylated-DNA-[protein]-cysteine S-methyltransferase